MDYKDQMKIADEVLEKLYPISPYAIVAGGAPRDWYFEKEAVDIDVFLYRPDLVTSHSIISVFKSIGMDIWQIGHSMSGHPQYEKNALIYKVFNCTYKNVNFQFIFMKEKTFTSVVPKFPLNICMIWYKDKIHTTRDFNRAVKHKVIVKMNPLYADGDKYIKKIKERFPDYDYYDNYEKLAGFLLDS